MTTMLLDGVTVYSTCRDCGLLMQVTDMRQTTHPMCQPKPTKVENWEQTWLSIASTAPPEGLPPHLQAKLDDLEAKMEAESTPPTALHNAVMEYAQWGWPVFPLARRSKKPAIPKSKGGNGFLDATSDTARLCRWWSRHPDDNVGIATGHGFDVVDVDPGHGGDESLTKLLAAKNFPTVHGIVVTAGNDEGRPCGMHLYVKATGKGCFLEMKPGIDYRGLGGYVVGPPSTLGSRIRSWSWAVAPSPVIKEKKT